MIVNANKNGYRNPHNIDNEIEPGIANVCKLIKLLVKVKILIIKCKFEINFKCIQRIQYIAEKN
jgi:hypothetical protein